MKNTLNVLVYGGGAVGSILGWRIAQNSHAAVSVVCRSNWNVVRASGYQLDTNTWGRGHFIPRQVLKSGSIKANTQTSKWDFIILANKIRDDYGSTLAELQSAVSADTTLVTAQNGMDIELPVARKFPQNTVLSAICNVGCAQVLPGRIEQKASIKRSAFLIGAFGSQSPRNIQRRDVLAAMDPEFESIDCIEQERWRKLVLNSAWNSTTALSGMDTRELLKQPGAAELVFHIAREAHNIACASGVQLDSDLPTQAVELARTSLPITPSTLQDLRNKRPMELAPIFGYLVSQARRVGSPIPYLTFVHELLQQRNSAFAACAAPHEPKWRRSSMIADLCSRDMVARMPVVM